MIRDQLQARMAAAGLAQTVLRLHEPQDLQSELGRLSGELRVGIVQDLYERQAAMLTQREQRIRDLESTIAGFTRDTIPVEQITREVVVQYPSVERLSFGKVVEARQRIPEEGADPVTWLDTIPTVLLTWREGSTNAQRTQDRRRLAEWLRVRLGLDTLQIVGN